MYKMGCASVKVIPRQENHVNILNVSFKRFIRDYIDFEGIRWLLRITS